MKINGLLMFVLNLHIMSIFQDNMVQVMSIFQDNMVQVMSIFQDNMVQVLLYN